jgi:hypothetical protein
VRGGLQDRAGEGVCPQNLKIKPHGLNISWGLKNCCGEAIGDLYGAVNSIVVGVDGNKCANEQGVRVPDS